MSPLWSIFRFAHPRAVFLWKRFDSRSCVVYFPALPGTVVPPCSAVVWSWFVHILMSFFSDSYGSVGNALRDIHSSTYVHFSLLALSSIFFLVDPFAAIGSFLAITAGADAPKRKRMARKACITCFIVLSSFAVAGKYIFTIFGIRLPAFEFAGGLILMLIGIDMLEAKRSPTQESSGEAADAAAKEDAGIVPLGIPMLAGPGAISSVMVLVGRADGVAQWAAILSAIGLTAFASYWVLSAAERLQRLLGETGIRILVRIMGLLLVALAMQFFVNSLTDLGVIARPVSP